MITYAVSIHFYQNVNEIIALAVISIAEVNWESTLSLKKDSAVYYNCSFPCNS